MHITIFKCNFRDNFFPKWALPSSCVISWIDIDVGSPFLGVIVNNWLFINLDEESKAIKCDVKNKMWNIKFGENKKNAIDDPQQANQITKIST